MTVHEELTEAVRRAVIELERCRRDLDITLSNIRALEEHAGMERAYIAKREAWLADARRLLEERARLDGAVL